MSKKAMVFGNRNGATMVVVMGLTLLGTLAASSVMFGVGARVRQSYMQVYLEQAFYLAQAGAERVASYVADGNDSSTTLTGTRGAGSYRAVLSRGTSATGEIEYNVVSTGTVNNVSRGVVLHGLQHVSWARYALWYNSEAMTLWIAAGDSFKGRVYSTPYLRFNGTDISTKGRAHFYDKASTAKSSIIYDSGAYPIFDKGLVTSADLQSMGSIDFAVLKSEAAASGLVLTGNATIVLEGSTMKVTNIANGWTNHVMAIPDNGLVYAQKPYTYTKTTTDRYGRTTTTTVTELGDITVSAPSGLSGRLSLVSDNNIYIANHVRYADDPRTDSNSTDALGLIANNNVSVQTSAPDNLDIFAHIICKNGGFGVADYDNGDLRGTLNVYGGIVNEKRNAVGVVGTSGYLKLYIFDVRFTRDPPPFYPTLTDELEWREWEG